MHSGVSLANAFVNLLVYAIEKMNRYECATGNHRVSAEFSSELAASLGGLGL